MFFKSENIDLNNSIFLQTLSDFEWYIFQKRLSSPGRERNYVCKKIKTTQRKKERPIGKKEHKEGNKEKTKKDKGDMR